MKNDFYKSTFDPVREFKMRYCDLDDFGGDIMGKYNQDLWVGYSLYCPDIKDGEEEDAWFEGDRGGMIQ